MADWVSIKTEYISTQISTRALAEKYGVSYSALEKRCRKEKWTAERGRAAAEVRQKVVAAVAEREADRVSLLIEDGVKAQRMLSRFLDEADATGEIRPSDIKVVTDALKNLRDLYKMDAGADDVKYQKVRELLGGVPDALDG